MTTSDSLSNNGGPAFPAATQIPLTEGGFCTAVSRGMTLRDYFAAQALPLIGAAPVTDWQLKAWFGNRGGLTREEIAARAAYEYADAMLLARQK